LELARELFENKQQWHERICEFAAKNLTALANDWNPSQQIDEQEFKSKISLAGISIESNGAFTFLFDDGDFFGGHTVEITGNMLNGPDFADITG
jgi:hypothetical protein